MSKSSIDSSLPETASLTEIAVVGMAGRFPGAASLEEFWQNLRDGVNSVSFFTDEELADAGVEGALLQNPRYVKAAGVLEGVELFDAAFFGYTPREAEIINPQQRLFLECAWQALEHAGYDPEAYEGRVGVYAGASLNRYLLDVLSNRQITDSTGGLQILIGNKPDHLATRVSYKLNLKGPSVNVQSACSTSLVAVALACQSLLDYQCDMALAGGVSVVVPQKNGYVYEEGDILSPDGYCRAFDARAAGTVGGNGLGVVALKRLGDALAAGDYIHAVVKGWAVNNDGSFKAGYTAPSLEGQAEVIAEALAVAGVAPETITYVEAHGTATRVGDPIELMALSKAFRAGTAKRNFCAVGSVKTNIGHLDAAAGVAGLIKTVLALEHKQIPPSLHYEQPNPSIDFASSPFFVGARLAAWDGGATPRRAGVSSFGIGGTNAHVILEEAPPRQPPAESRAFQILTLSAKTESALEAATENLLAHLKTNPHENLADVAYTLHAGRREFAHRRAFVCRDMDDALRSLANPSKSGAHEGAAQGRDRAVVMMFPGQGTQYAGMAAQLYRRETGFREQVDLCSELLRAELGFDLRATLFPTPDAAASDAGAINRTAAAQPALFVVEYALARLWMAWGVVPEAMIGHSIGEYVAACLAGVMSLEDALGLVAARGRLMQQLPEGSMLAVSLAEADARATMKRDPRLDLAAVNAPSRCVISGASEAVARLSEWCEERDIPVRTLHTSHAFHSQMMEPVLEEFAARVGRVVLNPPQIPFISNVTGTWITDEQATEPGYWARHLRQTVRFGDGVAELAKRPERIFLEVGAGRTLAAASREVSRDADASRAVATMALPSLRHPLEDASDLELLLGTLGQLWQAGVKIDWAGFHAHERRSRLPLPAYPFERRHFWVEGQQAQEQQQSPERQAEPEAPRPATDAADWFYAPVWKQSPLGSEPLGAVAAEEKTCWLVLLDDCGLGSRLVRRIEGLGRRVATVSVGSEFAKTSERAYVLNPQRHEDYERLVEDLRAAGLTPERIIHLWSVTERVGGRVDAEREAAQRVRGFDSLLHLARSLAAGRCPIEVVSNNLHDVTGEETLCPEKATILGACLVIPCEFPNLTCRSFDVLLPPKKRSAARELQAGQLLEEFLSGASDSPVAYRGRHRWTQDVERVRLDAPKDSQLRDGGKYLITGGLAGFGLTCAAFLVRAAKNQKLILTVRDYFPERYEWQQWLSTHDGKDDVSGKIREAQALEEAGAEVLVKSVNVTSRDEVRLVVAQARERFGEIDGVIHAEENFGLGLIRSKTAAGASVALDSRVRGTLALDAELIGTPLDFFVLCSAAASLDNLLGRVDVCAGNAFLDAFARYDAAGGRRFTTALDWGLRHWDDAEESLLSNFPEALSAFRQNRQLYGLTLEEGVEALGRVLSRRLPQVVISKLDFQLARRQQAALEGSCDVEKLLNAMQKREPARAAAVPGRAPTSHDEQAIALIWQEVLGVEQAGIDDNFFESGGDSLSGIQLMSRLRKAFTLDLPMSALFESPTVAGLAAAVEQQLRSMGDGDDELETMIAEIESLSSEDLDAEIAAVAGLDSGEESK
jgi:acyl transferase domain-containing protein/acyl carrier protein